jgi:inward rectifier potassium channel
MYHTHKKISINGQPITIVGLERTSIWSDFYYFVLVSSWFRIIMLLAILYLSVNVVFAALYLLGGDCIDQATPGSFWDTFFFSVQTWATIGYGSMAPKSHYADVLVAVESFLGLLSMSVVTGLVFSKFAQPKAKVRFTKNILLSTFDGKPTLIFRIGNMRGNQIVEARLVVVWSTEGRTLEGVEFRKLQDLTLVRTTTVMFSLTWTAMHIIDESSPLFNVTSEMLKNSKAEVVVSLTGLDAEFNQTVHARTTYRASDFIWGDRFADVIGRDAAGQRLVDYREFDRLVTLNA